MLCLCNFLLSLILLPSRCGTSLFCTWMAALHVSKAHHSSCSSLKIFPTNCSFVSAFPLHGAITASTSPEDHVMDRIMTKRRLFIIKGPPGKLPTMLESAWKAVHHVTACTAFRNHSLHITTSTKHIMRGKRHIQTPAKPPVCVWGGGGGRGVNKPTNSWSQCHSKTALG